MVSVFLIAPSLHVAFGRKYRSYSFLLRERKKGRKRERERREREIWGGKGRDKLKEKRGWGREGRRKERLDL